MDFLNVRVSECPLIPMFSMFSFISSSRILPQFRAFLPVNKLHSLSLSSSPAPVSLSENSSNEHSFEVSYLVNSFGLPPELAISRAKFLKFNTTEKPEKVLAFFKKHGFTITQISIIARRYPRIIFCDPEKTLLPKLGFFSSIGLSTTEITSIITATPAILKRSLKKVVIPSFNVLRNLIEWDDKAIEMVKRYPLILTHEPEVDIIQILREVGVPDANIVVSMSYQPRGSTPTADNYRKIVEKVKEMGFDPSSMMFIYAIRAMRSISKATWERKVQVFKKYGWSDCEILLAFEKNPNFIMASEDKIVGVMDFLVNRIGVEATTVANWPGIFGMSLEKRIVPRCLLYQVVVEQGLCKRKRKLSVLTLLNLTENQFLTRIIKPYEKEAPELLDLYQEMLDI